MCECASRTGERADEWTGDSNTLEHYSFHSRRIIFFLLDLVFDMQIHSSSIPEEKKKTEKKRKTTVPVHVGE